MLSPEFGAGPTLAAAIPQTMLAKTKSTMAAHIFFFHFLSSYFIRNITLCLI
jgi:hypothetical protein